MLNIRTGCREREREKERKRESVCVCVSLSLSLSTVECAASVTKGKVSPASVYQRKKVM